jgi:hypothetical protein
MREAGFRKLKAITGQGTNLSTFQNLRVFAVPRTNFLILSFTEYSSATSTFFKGV